MSSGEFGDFGAHTREMLHGSERIVTQGLSRCTIPGIAVQFTDGGKRFVPGEIVDLDAPARPGLTWRAALGTLANTFEPVGTARPATAEE